MASPGTCPHCGAPASSSATFCTYCGGALGGPPRFPPPPAYSPPVAYPSTSPIGPHSAIGIVLLVLGILLVLTGIGLLVTAAVIHQGVQSFNQACAQNSLCQPQSDPSGAIGVGGVVLLLLGIVMAIIGFVHRD